MDDLLPDYMKKNGQLRRYDGPGTEPVGPSKELLDPKLQALVDPWDPSTFEEPNPQNTGVLTKEMLDSMGQQVGDALSPVTGGPQEQPRGPGATPLPPLTQEAPAEPPEGGMGLGAPDPGEQRKIETEDRVAQLQPLRPEDKVGEARPDLRNPLTGDEPMSLRELSKQISELQGRQDRSQRTGMAGSVLGALSSIIGAGLTAAGRAKGRAGLVQAGGALGQSGSALNQLLQVPGKNVQQRLSNLQDQYNDAFNRDIRGKENQRGERRLEMEEELQPLEVAKGRQSLESGSQSMAQRAQQMELAGSAEERAQAEFELEQEAMRQAQNMSDEELRQAVLNLSPGTPPNALDNANHRELMSLYAQFQVADKKAKGKKGAGSGGKPRRPEAPPAQWAVTRADEIRAALRESGQSFTEEEVQAEVRSQWAGIPRDKRYMELREATKVDKDELKDESGFRSALSDIDRALEAVDRLPSSMAGRVGNVVLGEFGLDPGAEQEAINNVRAAIIAEKARTLGGPVTPDDQELIAERYGLPRNALERGTYAADPERTRRVLENARRKFIEEFGTKQSLRGRQGPTQSTIRVRLLKGPQAGRIVSLPRQQAESNPDLFEVVE